MNPFFIARIGFDGRELHNTRDIIFMRRLYYRLHRIPVLGSSLIESHDLLRLRETSLPPVDTLHRIIIHTRDQMGIQKIDRNSDSFWFRRVCDVYKKK